MAVLYYLTFTAQGLRLLVDHIPREIGRMELELGTPEGTLAQGFRLSRFELRHDRVHIVALNMRGRLTIAPLLWQTITLPDLEFDRLLVRLRPRDAEIQRRAPRFLPALLRVRVDEARIADASLIMLGGRRYDVTDVRVSGVAGPRTIRVYTADLTYGSSSIAASGTVRAAQPLRIDGDARLVWNAPERTRWVLNGAFDGDLDRLDVEATLSEPFNAVFEGAALTLTRGWSWNGNAGVRNLDLRAFGGGAALGAIAGELQLAGDPDGIRVAGSLDPAGLGAGPFDVSFDGAYAAKTLRVRHTEIRHPASGAQATIAGSVDIVPGGPRLDLAGRWRGFRWPLVGDDIGASSPRGAFTLGGSLPYAVTARGDIAIAGLAPMPVSLTGSLAADRLTAESLIVEAYEGRANLGGHVRWAPRESWAIAGRVQNLDTGLVRASLPGKIDFRVVASGAGFANGTIDLRLANLTGRIRGGTARGGGHLTIAQGVYTLDDVNIALGATRLAADGTLGASVRDLRFDLAADDLALLDPAAQGVLQARGNLRGTANAPVIDAVINAKALDFAGIELESLDTTIAFDGQPGGKATARIDARGLSLYGRRVDALDLDVDGTAENHRLRLEARSAPLAVRIAGDGAYEGAGALPSWQLRLAAFDIEDSAQIDLRLDTPTSLTVNADASNLERTCLSGTSARLCASAGWSSSRWGFNANATGLPIAALAAGFLRDVTYGGTASVDVTASGQAGAPWIGTLRAELRDANARRRLPSGRDEVTVLGTGVVTGAATREALTLDANLSATLDERRPDANAGSIRLDARAEREGPAWQGWPLSGSARVVTSSLDFIALLVDPIDRSEGKLDAALTLGGTLGEPAFTGRMSLRDGEFDLYQINMRLRAVTFDAQFAENSVKIDGSARAADGNAKVGGELVWRRGLPYGNLTLKGENFRVANVPEASILASPDLDFAVDGRRIHVTGEVVVPYARLDPADVTNAVFPSADEIIVGQRQADPGEQFVVTTEVRLTLGDRVTIDTFGLSGRLSGSVLARTDAENTARGTGEINVDEGTYVAFGRKLDIERGKLIFNNGLLADPGIDIRASKEFPDVTAGANVRGTLRAPRLTLFSDPQIAQSQILSLLLAGGSLESVQRQDTAGSRGGNALAVQGGAILAQQLGNYVGLEDVSLESTLDNDTSIVLGKYLTPRLYVSYGISLTEAINTIKMRYTLGDRWTLKFESGQYQGADLEYTIEK